MKFNLNKFKERTWTIDSIGLLYILVVGGLCHILPIPEIVKGFLALPGFLIIPYLLGNIFIPSNLFEDNTWQSKISKGIISWMLGLLLLVLGAIIFVKIFDIIYYVLLIFVVITAKILTGKHHPIDNQTEILRHIKRNYKEIIILVLIISLPLILIKSVSPFPLNYIADPFHFSMGAHQVMNHSLITQGAGYFPFIEIIVAIISIIYNINPFTLFWTGAFFSYPALAVGIYLLVHQLSKNKNLSLIAALFAIFPACYKTTWAMVLYMFIPQIWIYFTFPFAVFIIHKILQQNTTQISTKRFIKLGFILFLIFLLTYKFSMSFLPAADDPFIKSLYLTAFCFISTIMLRLFFNTKISIITSIVFGFIIMQHFPMSAVAIALLITYIFLHFLSKYSLTYYHFVAYTLLFCLTIAIFLHIPGYIQPSEKYFTNNIFTYDFSQKMNLLEYSFSYLTIIFFIIGAIYTILTRSHHTAPLSFLLLSLIALFIYFINIPELIRVSAFLAVFGIYIVAQGFLFVSRQLNILIFRNKKRSIVLALLLIIAIPLIIHPMSNFVNWTIYASAEENTASTFTYADYNASLWIKNNVPNALIISDSYTSYVVSAISGSQFISGRSTNNILQKNMNNIITTHKSDESYNITTLILSQNISADLSKIKKDDIFQVKDIILMRIYNFEMNLSKKNPIVVITPLTLECERGNVACSRNGAGYVVNKQLNESDPSIKKFFDSEFFELIYKDDNKIYIFRVKHLNEQGELTHKTNQSNIFKTKTE